MAERRIKIQARELSIYYGSVQAIEGISLDIHENEVTGLIGPSGCGKSTFLRAINRMNDVIQGMRLEGELLLDGQHIYGPRIDVVGLRRRVGMVFQRPTPFSKSVFENVAYGLKVGGIKDRNLIGEKVEESLRKTGLWNEIRDRLSESALELSDGQQQRLCIARALAVEPEVLLMDEPCSSLDPTATLKIEELIHKLKNSYTIVLVTHNMQQAARVSDRTAFFDQGRLVEVDETDTMFTRPQNRQTEEYITGRYG